MSTNLFTKLRDFLSGRPSLRNRPGGLAWVRFPASDPSAVLNGHVVKTVRADGDGFWELEPEQSYVTEGRVRDATGLIVPAAYRVTTDIFDDCLVPIPDAKLSKSEVAELYLSAPVKRKETV